MSNQGPRLGRFSKWARSEWLVIKIHIYVDFYDIIIEYISFIIKHLERKKHFTNDI